MTTRIDDADWAIIGCLQVDGRVSNREVARLVGLSEAAVRARIQRLRDGGAIRIMAVPNAAAPLPAPRTVAFVGAEVDLARLAEVVSTLTAIPEVSFVATTIGRFNVLMTALVADQAGLLELLNERIAILPGVRRTETFEGLRPLKFDYRWARLHARQARRRGANRRRPGS